MLLLHTPACNSSNIIKSHHQRAAPRGCPEPGFYILQSTSVNIDMQCPCSSIKVCSGQPQSCSASPSVVSTMVRPLDKLVKDGTMHEQVWTTVPPPNLLSIQYGHHPSQGQNPDISSDVVE